MPRKAHLLALVVLAAPAFTGCAAPEAPPADVVATFYPLAFLAQRIAGDNVTVGTLVPAGVEPHDWDAAPSDLARLAGTRVLLAQGLGFEPWLDRLRAQLPPTVATTVTTANVTPRAGDDSAVDPHTWLDPLAMAHQARAVEDALTAAWPEHADAFAARAAQLQADLATLHAEYSEGLALCDLRFVIANHDAYAYLAARYNFTVHAIRGLNPEAEPDVRTVSELIDLAREHNVTIVFFEELASPRVAEIVAKEAGAETRILSPIEGLTPEASSRGDDYVDLMRANLANLREAMRCE